MNIIVDSKLEYEEKTGIIVLLDALGVKGIWKNHDPKDIIKKWESVVDSMNVDVESCKEIGIELKYRAFSDTLVLTATGGEKEEMVDEIGNALGSLIPFGMGFGIYFRGCLSYGKFYESNRMIIGPAIDEAAMYFEKSNWIGVFGTPSIYSIIKKNPSKFIGNYLEYTIPSKGKSIESYAVVLLITLTDKESGSDLRKYFNHKDTLIDFIHDKLENMDDPTGAEKWKNTLDFLYYVQKKKPGSV